MTTTTAVGGWLVFTGLLAAHHPWLALIVGGVVGLAIPSAFSRSIRWSYLHGALIRRNGAKITFVNHEGVVCTGNASSMSKLKGVEYIFVKYSVKGRRHTDIVKFRERGTLWCFGWEGPDADGLRAARALS